MTDATKQFDFNSSILVIDDDAMVRAVIVAYLKSFGFHMIHEASSGAQAIRLIRDEKTEIDLILSDWEMPGIDGLGVLKAARKLSVRRNVGFIIITSQTPQERQKIIWARNLGVSSYIVKPFNGDILKEKIWSVFGWPSHLSAS